MTFPHPAPHATQAEDKETLEKKHNMQHKEEGTQTLFMVVPMDSADGMGGRNGADIKL